MVCFIIVDEIINVERCGSPDSLGATYDLLFEFFGEAMIDNDVGGELEVEASAKIGCVEHEDSDLAVLELLDSCIYLLLGAF